MSTPESDDHVPVWRRALRRGPGWPGVALPVLFAMVVWALPGDGSHWLAWASLGVAGIALVWSLRCSRR